MNLTFVRIEAAGDIERERIVLKASADLDAGDYAIFRCRRASNGRPSAGNVLNAYWFPYLDVTAGSYVILYTKSGKRSEKDITGNKKSLFFYWGCKQPIWNDGAAPVILRADDWETDSEDETQEPKKETSN